MKFVDNTESRDNVGRILDPNRLVVETTKAFWTESSSFLVLQESFINTNSDSSHFRVCSNFFDTILDKTEQELSSSNKPSNFQKTSD
jgi:hypothetical protein